MGFKRPTERLLDAETEKQLDLWVEAKRRRDYETADRIRAELKAQGVDANTERPQKGKGKGKDKKGKDDDKGDNDWKKRDWDDNKDWKKDGGDWKKDDWKKDDWKKDDWKKDDYKKDDWKKDDWRPKEDEIMKRQIEFVQS